MFLKGIGITKERWDIEPLTKSDELDIQRLVKHSKVYFDQISKVCGENATAQFTNMCLNHSETTDHIYLILRGKGAFFFTIEGIDFKETVETGDMLLIPQGQVHSFGETLGAFEAVRLSPPQLEKGAIS